MTNNQDKISIPSSVIDILNEVVSDLDSVAKAITDAGGGSYVMAVEDLVALIQHVIVKYLLPKMTAS